MWHLIFFQKYVLSHKTAYKNNTALLSTCIAVLLQKKTMYCLGTLLLLPFHDVKIYTPEYIFNLFIVVGRGGEIHALKNK